MILICFSFFLLFYFFIEVQLNYNVVLVSGVQQSDSVIYSFSDSFPIYVITEYLVEFPVLIQ